jgi:2-methylisocitrate lyase-like PEP mutase family enzyme
MPFPDLLRVVAAICRVANVPVSVDVERGFGADVDAVARNVSALIDAGAVGVNIEDGIDPAAGALRPAGAVAERIAALRAMAAARGLPLFVNARTDVFFLPAAHPQRRLEEAVARLGEYARAGADGAFAPGLTDLAAIKQVAAAIGLPLNVYAGYAGVPTVAELAAAGARRISVGCGPLQGLLGQAEGMAREILEEGRWDRMVHGALDAGGVNRLFT